MLPKSPKGDKSRKGGKKKRKGKKSSYKENPLGPETLTPQYRTRHMGGRTPSRQWNHLSSLILSSQNLNECRQDPVKVLGEKLLTFFEEDEGEFYKSCFFPSQHKGNVLLRKSYESIRLTPKIVKDIEEVDLPGRKEILEEFNDGVDTFAKRILEKCEKEKIRLENVINANFKVVENRVSTWHTLQQKKDADDFVIKNVTEFSPLLTNCFDAFEIIFSFLPAQTLFKDIQLACVFFHNIINNKIRLRTLIPRVVFEKFSVERQLSGVIIEELTIFEFEQEGSANYNPFGSTGPFHQFPRSGSLNTPDPCLTDAMKIESILMPNLRNVKKLDVRALEFYISRPRRPRRQGYGAALANPGWGGQAYVAPHRVGDISQQGKLNDQIKAKLKPEMDFIKLVCQLPLLEDLGMKLLNFGDEDTVNRLVKDCPRLRRLYIEWCVLSFVPEKNIEVYGTGYGGGGGGSMSNFQANPIVLELFMKLLDGLANRLVEFNLSGVVSEGGAHVGSLRIDAVAFQRLFDHIFTLPRLKKLACPFFVRKHAWRELWTERLEKWIPQNKVELSLLLVDESVYLNNAYGVYTAQPGLGGGGGGGGGGGINSNTQMRMMEKFDENEKSLVKFLKCVNRNEFMLKALRVSFRQNGRVPASVLLEVLRIPHVEITLGMVNLYETKKLEHKISSSSNKTHTTTNQHPVKKEAFKNKNNNPYQSQQEEMNFVDNISSSFLVRSSMSVYHQVNPNRVYSNFIQNLKDKDSGEVQIGRFERWRNASQSRILYTLLSAQSTNQRSEEDRKRKKRASKVNIETVSVICTQEDFNRSFYHLLPLLLYSDNYNGIEFFVSRIDGLLASSQKKYTNRRLYTEMQQLQNVQTTTTTTGFGFGGHGHGQVRLQKQQQLLAERTVFKPPVDIFGGMTMFMLRQLIAANKPNLKRIVIKETKQKMPFGSYAVLGGGGGGYNSYGGAGGAGGGTTGGGSLEMSPGMDLGKRGRIFEDTKAMAEFLDVLEKNPYVEELDLDFPAHDGRYRKQLKRCRI